MKSFFYSSKIRSVSLGRLLCHSQNMCGPHLVGALFHSSWSPSWSGYSQVHRVGAQRVLRWFYHGYFECQWWKSSWEHSVSASLLKRQWTLEEQRWWEMQRTIDQRKIPQRQLKNPHGACRRWDKRHERRVYSCVKCYFLNGGKINNPK